MGGVAIPSITVWFKPMLTKYTGLADDWPMVNIVATTIEIYF